MQENILKFIRKRAFLLQANIANILLFLVPTMSISCSNGEKEAEVMRLSILQLVFGINQSGFNVKPQIFASLIVIFSLVAIVLYFVKSITNNRKTVFIIGLIGFSILVLLQIHVYLQVVSNQSASPISISWKWPYWLSLAFLGCLIYANKDYKKGNTFNELLL